MFLGVWILISVAQVLIVSFGGKVFKVHASGLTASQWAWCTAVGSTSLLWNFILKFIPDTVCPVMGKESEEKIEEAN